MKNRLNADVESSSEGLREEADRPEANVDVDVAKGFGDEWKRFDQSALAPAVRERLFQAYFQSFPWESLPKEAIGADFGCGSGRWAVLVAPRVHRLICVDASHEALSVARRNLAGHANCMFLHASVGDAPIPDSSLDFAYSLGVLHHIPDTGEGMRWCVRKLKRGAPFLVYLYYKFDNRPRWFRVLWGISNYFRIGISRLPFGMRYWISQAVAAFVYWPAARLSRLVKPLGLVNFPLSFYGDKPFYVMRTDALDRFGTRLEKRFTRGEIEAMMTEAGLVDVQFSSEEPFWCAIGIRA